MWIWRCLLRRMIALAMRPLGRRCCGANLRSRCAPPVRRKLHATLPVRISVLSGMLPFFAVHARTLPLPGPQHSLAGLLDLVETIIKKAHVTACRHGIERKGGAAAAAHLRLTGARLCEANRTPLYRYAAHAL